MRHIVEIVIPALFGLFTIGAIVHTIIQDRKHKARMQACERDNRNLNDLFRETYLNDIGTLAYRPINVNNYVTQLGTHLEAHQTFLRDEHRDTMARIYQDALVFGTGIGELRMVPQRRTPKKRNLPDWW